MRVPVLTYHSINIGGPDYARNDHAALTSDLDTIAALGLTIVRLRDVVDALDGRARLPERAVALSFDDGSWFDWHDLDHPSAGRQRGMAGILRDFRARTGRVATATSFVIVSPEARAVLDRTCMIGRGWWTDDWWPQATAEGLIDIESHSWDHNHDTLLHTAQREGRKGTFLTIATHAEADAEIRAASAWLDTHCPGRRTRLFAYPYGEANDYLAEDYLPRHRDEHGLDAAFTTRPAPIEATSDRWRLPRYVCGHDWRSPEALAQLLRDAT